MSTERRILPATSNSSSAEWNPSLKNEYEKALRTLTVQKNIFADRCHQLETRLSALSPKPSTKSRKVQTDISIGPNLDSVPEHFSTSAVAQSSESMSGADIVKEFTSQANCHDSCPCHPGRTFQDITCSSNPISVDELLQDLF